jgi:GNAT superfamily N-acetyltransferase
MTMSTEIAIAETPEEIDATWPVMHQLRPHLDAGSYLAAVLRLRAERDFRLARMTVDGVVVAAAGLRFGEWLHGGRYLEIEDFVTREECRSKGYGGEFFDWIVDLARESGCRHLRLLSGTQREAAHRFYRRKGMNLEAYYFSLDL